MLEAAMETQTLQLRLVEARALTPVVRLLCLRAADGRPLPAYAAGAHLRLTLPLGSGLSERDYSLVNLDGSKASYTAPAEYWLAVQREDAGRGGSRHVHEVLKVGDLVCCSPPRNDFMLAEGSAPVLLLAGGIGITPLASMACRLLAEGRDFRMVYAGRSRSAMALLDELTQRLGPRLTVHADDEAGTPLPLATLLAACPPDEQVYVCGPSGLLDAALAQANRLGWPDQRLHFERFTAAAPVSGDHAFEVVLARSQRCLQVPADRSLLDLLIEAGCDPLYDCRRGECGVCSVTVLEGEIDHRDHVLTPAERQHGHVLQACVSRGRGQRLVLDL